LHLDTPNHGLARDSIHDPKLGRTLIEIAEDANGRGWRQVLPCPLHQRTRILARFRTVNVGHRDLEAAATSSP